MNILGRRAEFESSTQKCHRLTCLMTGIAGYHLLYPRFAAARFTSTSSIVNHGREIGREPVPSPIRRRTWRPTGPITKFATLRVESCTASGTKQFKRRSAVHLPLAGTCRTLSQPVHHRGRTLKDDMQFGRGCPPRDIKHAPSGIESARTRR